MENPMIFFGVKIYANPNLTELEEYIAQRTWGERLFTLPWRPWLAEEKRSRQIPSRQIYRTSMGIICHPAMVAEVRSAIKAARKGE